MSNERLAAAMEAISNMPNVGVRGGKRYTMVKDRVEIFRHEFGVEFGIETKVDYSKGFADGAPVVASAQIIDDNNRVVASGWAVEFVGSTDITDASPVEVAETSAIGRALACFGLHGGEYASLNEIDAAYRKQDFRQGNGPGPGPGPAMRDGGQDGGRIDYSSPGSGHPGDGRRGYEGPPPDERRMVNRSDERSDPRYTEPLARQVERNRLPVFYVPTDHDAVWLQPEVESGKIIDQVERIDSAHELGRYWADLKPAIDIFKSDQLGLDLIAEIKAAFATRHNMLGGPR